MRCVARRLLDVRLFDERDHFGEASVADTHEQLATRNRDVARIVALLEANAPRLREAGVTSLALFGSRVDERARPDSDLDVLIEYDETKPFTLYHLLEVGSLVEQLTGLRAHVATRDGFKPDRLARVLNGSIAVF